MNDCTNHPNVIRPTPLSLSQVCRHLKKFFILFIFLLFHEADLFAQQKITGVVSNDDNVPLSGATITLKNSNISTLTSNDGSFTINAKPGDVIEISFVGFKTQELTIGAETNLKIALPATILTLDDVVLTGYTSQKVKEITGSVAVVKPKDLISIPAGQVEQMLQGRVAGLNVITSGMPGGASNVRIHGIGNFGDVTPLYIIDGVQGNINNVNPGDIESLQVLKDAGAYAIYGVRGANGVVIITTRNGKIGKTKVNYDFYIGTTRPLHKGPDLLNPQEMADLTWLALRNSGDTLSNGNPNDLYYGNGPTAVLPDYLVAGPFRGPEATGPRVNPDLYNLDFTAGDIYQIVQSNKTGTDWFHQVFKPAISQNHTIAISGGNNKNKYLFSMGYLDQQGTLLNTYLKRFTVRINTSFAVSDKIRIGENLQLAYRDNPRIAKPYGPNNNAILTTFITQPILPVLDIKGGWAVLRADNLGENIVAQRTLEKDNKTNYWETFGDAWAEADFLKYFTARTQFGGTITNYYLYNYNLFGYADVNGLPNNSFSESSGFNRSWTWTNTLRFSKKFQRGHSIKILLGTEAISSYNRETGGSRSGYFTNDPNYRFLTNGNPDNQTNYSFAGTSALYSFMSRIDYGFGEKYFVTGTFRNDGSSVFGPKNRYGWFPSISAAWRVTEENFLKKSNWLTDLKVRASWGKTGFYGNTNPLNQYTLFGGSAGDAYYDILGTSNSVVQGFRAIRFGEPKTGWQEDIVINAGFESILWQGKLSINADWYDKKSKGLLFPLTLPDVLGGALPPNANVGNVKNTGVDVLIGSKGRFSKNWNWDATITLTTYKNKVIHLTDIPYFPAPFEQAGPFVRNQVGHPAGSFYGYKVIGFFQSDEDVNKSPKQDAAKTGRFKYQDTDGDGIITDMDRTFFGNPNPKFTAGINIGIGYKNFDFSTFFYGSFGNDVVNVTRALTDFFPTFPGGSLTAKSKIALYDSWTPQHRDAKAPIAEEEFNFSNLAPPNSYFLENGSYFRNKTMILGYTFPGSLLQKIKIEKVRIYVQAVNLFTITKYTGLDPELSGFSAAYGLDFGDYPNNQKQYLVGLNMNF
jgi:TonB-linked SusC/RagA family outer membrane protein